jgi:glycosidase
MRSKLLTTLILSAAALGASAQQSLERVEPPSWWTGMREPTLQLMLHGPGLAALEPRIEHPGVTLEKVTRLASPNYLFLDLRLDAALPPGNVDIQLLAQGKPVLRHAYPLQARAPGSAEREGFGPRDAIYLVVPDRFARGEPAPKVQLREGENRADNGGRHGGNLAGLAQRLDYIAGMGFTQIWPTPLIENDSERYSYHGYAATDFYKIDPRFGSNADFRALVQQARGKGLGLIQDIVLNHIGDKHWWMRDLPAPDWLNQWPQYTETHHARVSLQDPHAAPSDRERFASGWFTQTMPDLNQRQPQLATYLTQMSIWWVEYAGLSGIRTDTYSYSDRDFLARWSERLMREYPRLNIVGEEWSPHPAIVSYWQRGKKNHDGYVSHAPSMMDFPLHEALLAGLKQADSHDGGLQRLYEALAHDFLYPDPDRLVVFEGNHDTPRVFSALGEDAALTRMAWAYLAVVNRIPQFFYGSELLLKSPTQRDDGAVRADFPGGFPGDKVDGFSGRGLSAEQREAQAWLKRLLNWRKSARAVHEGRTMHYAPEGGVYVLFRHGPAGKVMLVLNKNPGAVTLDTRRFAEMLQPGAQGRDVMDGTSHALGRELRLPGRSARVLEVRD